MRNKPGDIRYVAYWFAEWEPHEDGEFYVDDQIYKEQVCEAKDEAAKIAIMNDYHSEGLVFVQEYQHKDFGLYDWFTIEEVPAWEVQ